MENDESTFEMSLRILGNEFIGFKIFVNDFKAKWIVLSIIATGAFGSIVAAFGEPIKNLFSG